MKNLDLLGNIISGSITDGFFMRISSNIPIEDIKIGKFVSVKGQKYTFFSLITDLKLEVSSQDISLFPPNDNDILLKSLLSEQNIYTTATLRPLICLDSNKRKQQIKTIPAHFAPVSNAKKEDISNIFGKENDEFKSYFSIGSPLDENDSEMENTICIDLDKFTERSNGIFGKTGTGKTFLTRLVLAGLISKEKAVTIIFDTHGEYGSQARTESDGHFVKGLKTLFSNKIVTFGLDSRTSKNLIDCHININYEDIAVEDIIPLSKELNLHSTAYETANLLHDKYGKRWLSKLLLAEDEDQRSELAQDIGAHSLSLSALYRKFKKIKQLKFIKDKGNDVITQMLEYIDQDRSIIIDFGDYTSTFCYLLLANIITRRLHQRYKDKTERFLNSQDKSKEPKKLMIVVEEAHKFLTPEIAKQTIFGTIAREMRKYYVSLLIVDQRPSDIDPEILSQISTKIIAQLNNDKDINAVLSGTANTQQLKTLLSGLESKQQVLVLGHAIAVPMVMKSRTYGEQFYRDVQTKRLKIDPEDLW